MDEFESERLAKEIYNSIEFGPLEESDARYVDLFNDYPSAIGIRVEALDAGAFDD